MLTQSTTFIADSFGWDHMNGWGWTGMIIGMILLAVLVVLAIIAITSGTRRSEERARKILDERYAHGEIDRDEYRERKRELDR